eukprot:4221099-Pyramimonas_sp.AAC.1
MAHDQARASKLLALDVNVRVLVRAIEVAELLGDLWGVGDQARGFSAEYPHADHGVRACTGRR